MSGFSSGTILCRGWGVAAIIARLEQPLVVCSAPHVGGNVWTRMAINLRRDAGRPRRQQHLTYWRADGSGWTFAYNTTLNTYSLASPPNERAQLVVNPATGGFTLTLADGTQRVFNSQNLLAAVIDRNNNQTTLAYDSSNRLTSVTSPGGSTLNFTYGDSNNPMQATTVQDVVGVVATYTYDSMSRLTLVSYPDGSALNFTYDPNSSMILSVADSQGKLLEAHTYDAQNRGLTSARAYGADSVSLVY